MRQELTRDQIRANLMSEYANKPGRNGKIVIVAGIIVGVLCFGTGRYPAALIGLACVAAGFYELRRSVKFRHILEKDAFMIKEGRCKSKRISSGQGGTRREFCMEDGTIYVASNQDIRLWEKTSAGEGFYLIYFEGFDKVMKIYPKQKFAYIEK